MSTDRYYIGLRHHSIASSREVAVTGTLAQAKRAATREFGDGFQDHEIIIVDSFGDIASRRRVSERRWTDADGRR